MQTDDPRHVLDSAFKAITREGPAMLVLKTILPIAVIMALGMGYVLGFRLGVFCLVFFGGMALAAAAIAQLGFVWPMVSRFRRAIRAPERIVRIYEEERFTHRRTSHWFIVVGLDDGNNAGLQATFIDRREVIAALARLAPQATLDAPARAA